MIGKLTGKYGGMAGEGSVIIEVSGVGYTVRVPLGAVQTLGRNGTFDISLFIHTAVREDAIDLYGFLTEEELSFFKQLMSVSGIGPKSALNILNVSDVQTLKRGIAGGDAASLTKVFGIGKKSAERIVVELRDKLIKDATSRGSPDALVGTTSDADVVEALMALGYSASEARLAIKEAGASAEGSSARLTAVLKHLGTRATVS
ncbi:MAG: Holliday junction branch migration protein RuvA [bacterium]|nr:Holliday junction branch migration protein RuvA [bacterium]